MKKLQLIVVDNRTEPAPGWLDVLGETPHQVMRFSTSLSALKYLETNRVDAILAKLHLPKISGVAFTELVLKNYPDCPVILFSDVADIPATVEAIKAGANDVILEDDIPNRLLPVLESATRHPSEERETQPGEAADTIREMKKKTFALALANIEMLGMQENLEAKNTELQSVLRELNQSKNNLQIILDLSAAGVLMVNADEKIVASNKQVANLFGIPESAYRDRTFSEFLMAIAGCFEDFEAFSERLGQPEKLLRSEEFMHFSKIDKIFDQSFRMVKPITRMIVPFMTRTSGSDDNSFCRIYTFMDVTQLKKADGLLHAIVEASPIPFIVSRKKDGKIIYANRPLAQLVGKNPKDVIGLPTLDFYANPQEREEILKKLEKDGYLRNHEIQIRRADGQPLWMSFSLITTELDGEPVVIGGLYDIDKRRRMEENLRLYRMIFDNANDPIAILDTSERILEVNPATEALFGYSVDEMIGRKPAELLNVGSFRESPPLRSDFPVRGIRQEFTLKTKDNQEIIVEISGFPIYNDEGQLIYRVGMTRDITKRKKALAALQQAHDELENRVKERTAELEDAIRSLRISEARNTALLNAIPDLMFRMTSSGTYLDYNAPKDSDLALPPEMVIGKTVYETMPPDLAERALAMIRKTIATNQQQLLEYEMSHHDHIHYFEARIVKSDEDEVISIVRDITERKLAEKALKKANDELENRVKERTAELEATNQHLRETQAQLVQSEKMATLGMLAAGVAHEINTPVGAISSMHDTQVRALNKLKEIIEKDEKLAAEPGFRRIIKLLDDAHRVVATGTERVINIVKQLRRFARLDEAELKEANIHEGIEDTLLLIHHEIKHNVTVVKQFGELPRISCYPSKLNQVVLNLLINAKQAMPVAGTVTIKTWHENHKVYISIADTGVGIPRENLERIFDPGFTTKGVGVGTGLGLSIVYRIIREDHKGDIQVHSELNKGTTFIVSIPDNLENLIEHT